MANSSTAQTNSFIEYGFTNSKRVRKIRVTLTGDDATGAMPDTTLEMTGFLIKVVTNPGSTAPTDNYDVAINDEHGADVAAGQLTNRSNTASQIVHLVSVSSGPTPPFVCGTHTMVITNTSVNSATIVMDLYLTDTL